MHSQGVISRDYKWLVHKATWGKLENELLMTKIKFNEMYLNFKAEYLHFYKD